MIKFFWNSNNYNIGEKDIFWGQYHKKNSNLWIKSILKKVDFKIIKDIHEIKSQDKLIIIDSYIHKKIQFYSKIKLACDKIFLFHLGDEIFHEPKMIKEIYSNCQFVWRTFCSNLYFNEKNVNCIPVGYKSGINLKNISVTKDLRWAFIGTPHKSSRHDLLFNLSEIKPNFVYKTGKFGDQNSLNSDQINEIFFKTDFIPCPNGFFHPETYRVYEALESGCIPIVEDSYNYYERLFPKNPFIKINKWSEAKTIIKQWNKKNIEKKKNECIKWWNDYKSILKNSIKQKIN